MTEGNFVDYVKYLFRPEKEEKDLRICIEKFIEKVDRMVVMEVVVDMFFL
jgi:hypothetical protein